MLRMEVFCYIKPSSLVEASSEGAFLFPPKGRPLGSLGLLSASFYIRRFLSLVDRAVGFPFLEALIVPAIPGSRSAVAWLWNPVEF